MPTSHEKFGRQVEEVCTVVMISRSVRRQNAKYSLVQGGYGNDELCTQIRLVCFGSPAKYPKKT